MWTCGRPSVSHKVKEFSKQICQSKPHYPLLSMLPREDSEEILERKAFLTRFGKSMGVFYGTGTRKGITGIE
jgi:hypothetical protein